MRELVSTLKANSLGKNAIKQSVQEVEKESKALENLLHGSSNVIYVYYKRTNNRVGAAEGPEFD